MDFTRLELERHDAVATVWLNRPEVHNAFDEVTITELTQCLKSLNADDTVRVVILGGRGTNFCAGADLRWMRRMATFSEKENIADAERLATLLHTLATLNKITVARVQGAALAGGMGLVAACDIAIASQTASFGTTEVRLGLIPATIAPYVIAAIGTRAAQRYFLSGERIDAATALQLGLVHEVSAIESLGIQLNALIAALLSGAPGAQAGCKELLRELSPPVTPKIIASTARRIAKARASAEAQEGMQAFFAKRSPRWTP